MKVKELENEVSSPPISLEEKPVRWWEPWLAWLLAGLVFLVFVPNILDKLNPVTGDEPFYLMTTISLLEDHDLDESNNYAKRDFTKFAPTCEQMRKPSWGYVGDPAVWNVSGLLAPGLRDNCAGVELPEGLGLTDLPPHFTKNERQTGSYTKHGLGLSFLIAPSYALAGRAGVVIFIALLAALLGVNIWLLAFETTGNRRVAWLVWGLLMFSTPMLCYAFLIFPATPAALLVVYSWRRLRLAARAQQLGQPDWQPNGPFRAILIGGCIGLLPWLHSVYLALSLTLVLYWLWGGRKATWRKELLPGGWSPLNIALLFLPIILSGGLFVAYYIWLYGTPLPNTQDHAGFAPLEQVPLWLVGLLFDQKYGLLIYGPFYLLALVGLSRMWKPTSAPEETAARRSDLIWMTVVAAPYTLIIADYLQWWGEWCPPARYLMPVLPLLAIPLSLAFCELGGRFFKIFCGAAAVWTFSISALYMYNPHLMWNWQSNNPAIILSWLEYNVAFLENAGLGRFFPSYVTFLDVNNGQPAWAAGCIWAGIGILIGVGLARSYRKQKLTL